MRDGYIKAEIELMEPIGVHRRSWEVEFKTEWDRSRGGERA